MSGGAPSPPARPRSSERGGSASRHLSGVSGRFLFSFAFGRRRCGSCPLSADFPIPASPSLWTLPHSLRTFHDVRMWGSLQALAPALYPPAIHALRCVNRGRIGGLGLERVALVDVAVSLAPAPLPIRGQEFESVRGGHRPRHARLVVAHVESGRDLLTAIALGVEALGRVVIGLGPRVDAGHAVTALDVSGRGLLTAPAPVVSVRVPLPRRGERRDRSRSHASPSRSVDRSRSMERLPAPSARLRGDGAGTTGQTRNPGGCGGVCLSASCGSWRCGGCYSCCRRGIHDRSPVCYEGACQVLFEPVWLLFPWERLETLRE